MTLPLNKTKIVCTMGPASASPEIIELMMRAGMNVARLNFSHGDFAGHARVIQDIRATAKESGHSIAIMADLPGPKLRIGMFAKEPVELNPGDYFTLTTEDVLGDGERVSISFERLPRILSPGHRLFLNDGYVQLEVVQTEEKSIRCRVVTGGELRSRKGLNLPGIDLGIPAFTEHDFQCMKFALENGVDAVSQSFVETEKDVQAVREAARSLGYDPFIIAKIERSRALDHVEDIVRSADGIMIARGDLGVEIPIEQIAVVQKTLLRLANGAGKPVITATQMLESMTEHKLPTRAEATDVANAVLDGTDCLMLSGETAMGRFPVESVSMLSRIASAIEPQRSTESTLKRRDQEEESAGMELRDLIALSVQSALRHIIPAALIAPSRSGATARSLARFKPPLWITAISPLHATCQNLLFSYGVIPVHSADHPHDWKPFAREWLRSHGVQGDIVILIEGPSPENPDANHRMEILDLRRG
ncbi:MAG: pyruvate kinase [Desulfobacteraceae bacterium]|nr:MAG: pyruvate kinase [Desulfobacteraceae bacterium]